MRFILIIILSTFFTSNVFASIFDGKWYGTNPCAIFDEPQDIILEIENGKAKTEWGEERNPSKYRGKIYQNDKLGLNSNDGRVEGFVFFSSPLWVFLGARGCSPGLIMV